MSTDEMATNTGAPPEPGDSPPPGTESRSLGLILAAVGVIAIPVLLGYFLLVGDDSSPSDPLIGGTETASGAGGMGGGMGGDAAAATGGAVAVELPAGVQAFSNIQATDIVIEPDGTGSAATLNVVTSIEVACAVAYGPTADLGLLATDTDMAGGGHTDHHPVMRGLAPETTYFYMVQAIGADGALYRSDVMQFTSGEGSGVPAVAPPAPSVTEFARVAEVSSQFSDAYSGANALDGDLSTEWSSAGDGDDAFIVLEFDENYLFRGVGFRTREMSDGTSITNTFTVTDDGGRTYGPFEAGPGMAIAVFDFSGESVRIDVDTSTGGNTGAVEIEVYGEPEM